MTLGDRVEGLGVRSRVLVSAGLILVPLLCPISSASASDASLRASVQTWSKAIAADARAVSSNASRRHPRLMTASAVRFVTDASRARASISRQFASTAKGRRAKGLALAAFTDYTAAGRFWAASGGARTRGQKALATALARRAALFAGNGNRYLLAAGKALD